MLRQRLNQVSFRQGKETVINIYYMPGNIIGVFTLIISLNLPNNWELGTVMLILWKEKLNLRKSSNLSKVTQLGID